MLTTQVSPKRQQSVSLQAEPTIERYFESFNVGNFAATAALFASDGQLHPPFEDAVVGIDAISQYLKVEAEGMQAYPQTAETCATAEGHRRLTVRGRVKALVFTVNTAWIFDLNDRDEIQSVQIKLLASLQELLGLRS